MLPTPRATRSKVLRHRDRRDSSELQLTTFTLSSCFPKCRSFSSAMDHSRASGRRGQKGLLGFTGEKGSGYANPNGLKYEGQSFEWFKSLSRSHSEEHLTRMSSNYPRRSTWTQDDQPWLHTQEHLRNFFQIWHKCPLGSKNRGHCDFAKHYFGLNISLATVNMTRCPIQ